MKSLKYILITILQLIILIIFMKKSISKNKLKTIKISKKNIINYFLNTNSELKYRKTVPIKSKLYGKNNNYYLYSTVLVQDKNEIMIQPIKRIEDKHSTNPLTLEKFNMVSVSINKRDMKKTLDLFLNFLKNYCKLDMKKIGCVSAKKSSMYNIEGIEKYIGLLEKYGIEKKNILARNPREAFIEGKGDGYWIYPGFEKFQGWTISFYFKLGVNSNISTYHNYNTWIEIAEIGDIIGAIGYERLNYVINIK